jgi:hypothetical protein
MALRSINDRPNYPVRNTYLDTSVGPFNGVVPAIEGRSIKVLAMAVITTLANSVYFLSDMTRVSATMPLADNGGFVLPYNPYGWFKTEEGEGLNVWLTEATQTGILIQYIEG